MKKAVKTPRKIIQIDEEKCDGCGACVDSCAEGALVLVDGKARLVKDQYCDGLAACLKECPRGALRIIEREAEGFDAQAVEAHLAGQKQAVEAAPCGCPGSAVRELTGRQAAGDGRSVPRPASELSHWPVQLSLVPPGAKFLKDADVMLVAQCVPFAYPNFHQDFLKGRAVLTACPKLDDADAHLYKMTEILKNSQLKSLSVVRMEVPCCSGLTYIAKKALELSKKDLPLKETVIGIDGSPR
jgi:Fe-S-cluster-containing hydrogenase component 2